MYMKLILYVKTIRPRHWLKNFAIFAAPFASGSLLDSRYVGHLLLLFVVFCAASSTNYVINDWIDKDFDSRHSQKSERPFASRQIGARDLTFLLLTLVALQTVIAYFLPLEVMVWVVIYLIFVISYSFYLKRIAVVELFVIGLGYLFRSLAGAQLVEAQPSPWFSLVIGFGALFLVTNKRLAEIKYEESSSTRLVNSYYSPSFLKVFIACTLSVTLMSYSLWAFLDTESALAQKVSVISFSMALVRYFWNCEYKNAEQPEIFLFSDKILVVLGMITFGLLWVSVYD